MKGTRFSLLLFLGALGAPASGLLAGTQWRCRLDVGREQGTWMPDEWGASGARLFLDTTVEFSEESLGGSVHEELVGPKESTKRINVCGGPTTFTGPAGTETVAISGGGWCLQRRHEAKGSEALLRFWLDCETGARRRDVSIPETSRLFFSTGCWDDPAGLSELVDQQKALVASMEVLRKEQVADDEKALARPPTASVGAVLRAALALPEKVQRQEEYDRLRVRCNILSDMLPPNKRLDNMDQAAKLARLNGGGRAGLGGGLTRGDGLGDRVERSLAAERAARGSVIIAPTGTLALKRQKALRTEYHILGTFSMRPPTAL